MVSETDAIRNISLGLHSLKLGVLEMSLRQHLTMTYLELLGQQFTMLIL